MSEYKIKRKTRTFSLTLGTATAAAVPPSVMTASAQVPQAVGAVLSWIEKNSG